MSTAAGAGGSRSASRHLVGRDEVLARLEALVEQTVAGHRLGTVLVEGPAGIGKTRVVTELASRLEARGVAVVVGHCVAEGELLPYAPVAELLAGLVRREGAAAVQRAAGPAAAELGRLLPALGDPGPVELDTMRSPRLFQALSSLLQNLSFEQPLVVVVEDVHWADTSTRELLALLARQQQGDLVLLLTLRTDESPARAGLSRYLAELVRRGDHRVVLQPLSREQQAHQISDILGVPPHRQLLDDVFTRAEGNPFFAEEVLALSQQGDEGLPATVRDLLVARLEALSPATQQVVRTASVVGRTSPHRLLAAAVDLSGERLDDALRSAVDAHVLEVEGDALAFRHALLQEAVAATLLPGEEARTHRRIAEALAADPALAGPGARVAGRLARHWSEAGDASRALSASLAAAQEAAEALAFAESLAHHEQALRLFDVVPDAEELLGMPRVALLSSAAGVAQLAGHPERAVELVRDAIALVGPDDVEQLGWLHERLGRYLWLSADTGRALEAYRRGVELVPEEPASRRRAAVLSGLSQMLMLSGRYGESEQLAREAITVAAQIPDGRTVEGHARNNLGVDLASTGRLEEGVAELQAARRIAEEQFDDIDDISRALVNLYSVLYFHGRLDEAADVALENVRVTESLGLQRGRGVWGRCDAAQVLLLLARWDEAGQLLEDARELGRQGIDLYRTDLVEGQLWLRRGDVARAQALLESAETAAGRLIDPHLLSPLYVGLVQSAVARGDDESASRWSEEGLRRLQQVPHPAHLAPLLAAVATAHVRAAPPRPDAARELLSTARAMVEEFAVRGILAEAEVVTATAELSGGVGPWRAAAETWEHVGDPFRAAYAHLRLAEELLASTEGRPEAAEHLRTALTTARQVGAQGLLRQAEDLGRRSRLRVEAAPDNPYRLTSREAEVLRLVADGLTDRAIGGRLFISHRTVERHVSNLLSKLDVDRRSELVATAHREGLLDPVMGSPDIR
ncbi:MAG TPA: AAA family ATPase [Nocardioides sp.]|uniref:ATP-binding protein n=1 Tax=Nocardioides sp. TaxID=35761 RepID=UPI002E3615AA|nr:AAA family ATPase [Nocardioides sp.]HEX5090576.1 AAA family ATPase [Nocardioides sp.]